MPAHHLSQIQTPSPTQRHRQRHFHSVKLNQFSSSIFNLKPTVLDKKKRKARESEKEREREREKGDGHDACGAKVTYNAMTRELGSLLMHRSRPLASLLCSSSVFTQRSRLCRKINSKPFARVGSKKRRAGGRRGGRPLLGCCFASFGSSFGMADDPKLIACVGDVHGLWNEESEEALRFLRPDLSLFVGDFGEEDVALVRSIAKIPERKAVILGNHDGWFSTSGKGSIEGVEEQLDLLGDDHVGLSVASLPDLGLSVVGCRPFSAGGSDWRRFSKFYRKLYGLHGWSDSETQIVGNAIGEPAHHDLIFLSHNGPTGLGSGADSICGIDWRPEEGDHGDLDMENAIREVVAKGRSISVVVFGHMHQSLHRRALPRRERTMFLLHDGVAYVNCAVVPRIRYTIDKQQHHFVLITLSPDNRLAKVESVWLQKSADETFETVETDVWYYS